MDRDRHGAPERGTERPTILAEVPDGVSAAPKSWPFDPRSSSRLRIGNEIVWSAIIKGTEIKRRR
jgi:hypothetical protein